MWSSSADRIGYLLNQEVAQLLTEELLELRVGGEDAPHIVPFGRGNVRADVGANMLEVARVLEDLPLGARIFPHARLQQIERKLRVDDLFRGELRKDGRQDRFVLQFGHVLEELGGKVRSTHDIDKLATLVVVD